MNDIVVKYNNWVLSPTPVVQQNFEFIDYGSRWGNVIQIELNGFVTGFGSWQAAQTGIVGYFTGQFGTLEVLEGSSSIYRWENVIVDEISFPPNHWFNGAQTKSMAPYSAKMKVINVPSGVLEPVNEYNFTQGEDGLVTVNHKVSARGIKNANDGLSNAVAFVNTFKGVNPFSSFTPSFIPSGSGILESISETIDRVTSTYSINEVYKYNTGLFSGVLDTYSINSVDSIDNEYLMIDVDWKIRGSPVNRNIRAIETNFLTTQAPIQKLLTMGYTTGNMIQSSYSVSRNSGEASIDIKASYVSGYNLNDMAGYFDYSVGLQLDGTTPKENWSINGEFVCFGPVQYRRTRVAAFKAASGSNYDAWRDMLTGLIIKSPVYAYHDSSKTFGSQNDLQVYEETGLGILKLSLTTSDGSHPASLWYPKYSVDVQAGNWEFNLLPSSNIEGQYVLQDLQMKSQSKVHISVAGETRDKMTYFSSLSGYVTTLSNIYINTGYVTSESHTTGILDVQYEKNWIGLDKVGTGIPYTKVAGTRNLTNYVRKPGYRFGY